MSHIFREIVLEHFSRNQKYTKQPNESYTKKNDQTSTKRCASVKRPLVEPTLRNKEQSQSTRLEIEFQICLEMAYFTAIEMHKKTT